MCVFIMIADANWSNWSKYGPCSKQCGGGSQYRSRKCDNPPPAYSGGDCVGPNRESRSCNTHPCKGKVSFELAKFAMLPDFWENFQTAL